MSINVDPSEWKLQTANGIPYKLFEGSPTGSFEEENAVAQEEYIIRASDLFSFVTESFPPMFTVDSSFSFGNKRTFPGLNTLLTRRISYEPFPSVFPSDPFGSAPEPDPGDPVAVAKAAATYTNFLKLTIEYGTGKNGSDTDPNSFVEISADAGGEFIGAPTGKEATWYPNGDAVEQVNLPRTIIIPETDWTVRWGQIPRAFFTATFIVIIRSRMGKVNSAAMPLLMGAAPGTILYMGYSMREQLSWRTGLTGQPLEAPVELEMRFSEKHLAVGGEILGHNHFYRKDAGEFQEIRIDGKKTYEETDLNALFPSGFK